MNLIESMRRQMPQDVAKASIFLVCPEGQRTWEGQTGSVLDGIYYPHNGVGFPHEVVVDACIRAATNPLLTGEDLQEVLQRYDSDAMFQEVVSPVIPDEGVGLQPFSYGGHHFLAVANQSRDEVVILVDPQNGTA